MLALPSECRRNYNCAEVEKVAVNCNIPTYQFAIIKLAVKLLMERRLEIKYQLALPFPGNFFSSNYCFCVIVNLRFIYVILNHLSDTKGFCYTISSKPLKKEPDDWDFFENLPATHAFKLDRVQISDEQSCKAHLANLDPQNADLYPENFIVLCTTIMDGWAEPNIEDKKLHVRS